MSIERDGNTIVLKSDNKDSVEFFHQLCDIASANSLISEDAFVANLTHLPSTVDQDGSALSAYLKASKFEVNLFELDLLPQTYVSIVQQPNDSKERGLLTTMFFNSECPVPIAITEITQRNRIDMPLNQYAEALVIAEQHTLDVAAECNVPRHSINYLLLMNGLGLGRLKNNVNDLEKIRENAQLREFFLFYGPSVFGEGSPGLMASAMATMLRTFALSFAQQKENQAPFRFETSSDGPNVILDALRELKANAV